jgi:hypothetical protein
MTDQQAVPPLVAAAASRACQAGFPMPDWPGDQQAKQNQVRQALLTAPELITVELAHGSGVILSTRR